MCVKLCMRCLKLIITKSSKCMRPVIAIVSLHISFEALLYCSIQLLLDMVLFSRKVFSNNTGLLKSRPLSCGEGMRFLKSSWVMLWQSFILTKFTLVTRSKVQYYVVIMLWWIWAEILDRDLAQTGVRRRRRCISPAFSPPPPPLTLLLRGGPVGPPCALGAVLQPCFAFSDAGSFCVGAFSWLQQ